VTKIDKAGTTVLHLDSEINGYVDGTGRWTDRQTDGRTTSNQ